MARVRWWHVAVGVLALALVGAGVSARSGRDRAEAPSRPAVRPPVAQLWIDADSGLCERSPAGAPYRDGLACSWEDAYAQAAAGDLVRVVRGSYGDVTLPNRTLSRPSVRFVADRGVVLRTFRNETSNVELRGPVRVVTGAPGIAVNNDGGTLPTHNIVYDGWRITQRRTGGTAFAWNTNVSNLTVRNADIGFSRDRPLVYGAGGRRVTFDNVRIHDARLTDPAVHAECLYADGVRRLALRRTRFSRCTTFNVFVTGSERASGWRIENSVFERTLGVGGRPSPSGYGLAFRTGGTPSPSPDGFVLRYNTFLGGVALDPRENEPTRRGFSVVGNVFLGDAPCGLAHATYAYNVSSRNPCGGPGARLLPASTIVAGFVSPRAGNFAIRRGSVLRDAAQAAGGPAHDLPGARRPQGKAADTGAYEYGSAAAAVTAPSSGAG